MGAYTGGFAQKPGPNLVMKILAFQRAYRTDVSGANGIVIVQPPGVQIEHRAIAQVVNPQLIAMSNLAAKTHAAPAQHAALLIQQHARADIHSLARLAPRQIAAREAATEAHRVVLQPAFPRLVANRAI